MLARRPAPADPKKRDDIAGGCKYEAKVHYSFESQGTGGARFFASGSGKRMSASASVRLKMKLGAMLSRSLKLAQKRALFRIYYNKLWYSILDSCRRQSAPLVIFTFG